MNQQNDNGDGAKQGAPAPAPQQQQPKIVLQPQQIHSLTESYKNEMAKANELGHESEKGKEHLRQANRIKLILLRFQQQQRLQRQQQQQQLQQQQQRQQGSPAPQSGSVNSTPNIPAATPVMQQPSRQPSLQNVPQQQPQQQQPQQQQAVNSGRSMSPVGSQAQFQSRQGSQSTPTPQASVTSAGSGAAGAPQQGQPQQQQHPNASVAQLQKIRKILDDFHARLRAIENTKRSGTLGPEELSKLVRQEELLKQRYDQYTRVAVQMSQQIQLRRNQLAAAQGTAAPNGAANQNTNLQQQAAAMRPAAANQSSSPAPQANFQRQQQQQQQQQQLQQQNQAARVGARTNSQQGGLNAQAQQQQAQMALFRQQQAQAQLAAQQGARQQSPGAVQPPAVQPQGANGALPQNKLAQPQQPAASRTPASAGRSASPQQASATPVTRVSAAARPSGPVHGNSGLGSANAASVVKSPVPTIPISSSINVTAPQPTTMKGSRPTAMGGGAFNAMPLTQPATYKLPQFEMEGDRVLHKRKLKELVRSVGADEGDGETQIDGDVEELLLDLADEFVSNVTSFACRLAKHRKVDTVDVKDIQLHLEKNWNIRIPGYSSDEIRSTRRFQPTAAYNQKLSGVDIAKSVKKDGN